ncbi:shikimate dehydrogenase family protein [Pseudomonas sp. NPDC089401]|uniref:shikimate dehydrogenase family protein n=1 Tax=Pseudomonas sp. NPDC089401 TaxID=3364462 RepID=UPI003806AFDF
MDDRAAISGTTRVFAILADPVAQVKSPQALNRLARERDEDSVLVPLHVAPADLGRVVAGLRAVQSIGGFVVTVPHKTAVVEYCDTVSDAVRQVGAANVVIRSADGRLHGHNLDGLGFVAGLRLAGIEPEGLSVYLAGAGGAACAIAFALAQAGVRALTVYNRTPAKARQLLDRLAVAHPGLSMGVGSDNPSEHDLVVNATSLGMREGDALPCDVTRLEPGQVVAEIIMEPASTPLLQAAKRQGCQTHPGVSMMEGQIELIFQTLHRGG